MNSVQLEQMSTSSSFSSRLIVNITSSLLRAYPHMLLPFHPKKVPSTEKTNQRTCSSYRSRRSRNAVVAISMQCSRA